MAPCSRRRRSLSATNSNYANNRYHRRFSGFSNQAVMAFRPTQYDLPWITAALSTIYPSSSPPFLEARSLFRTASASVRSYCKLGVFFFPFTSLRVDANNDRFFTGPQRMQNPRRTRKRSCERHDPGNISCSCQPAAQRQRFHHCGLSRRVSP